MLSKHIGILLLFSFYFFQATSVLRKKIDFSAVKVISYEVKHNRSNQDSIDCRSWNPPLESELPQLFGRLNQTSDEADYEHHPDYSCLVKGELLIVKDTYRFEINAGGYAHLFSKNKKNTIRLCANNDSTLKKYFLSVGYDSSDFR